MENIGPEIQNHKPEITRRGLLKVSLAASAFGAAALAAKQAGLAGSLTTSNTASLASETVVKTTCALCPSGCGLEVRVVDGKAVKVEGNPLHPLNQGVCCLKGQASLEVL